MISPTDLDLRSECTRKVRRVSRHLSARMLSRGISAIRRKLRHCASSYPGPITHRRNDSTSGWIMGCSSMDSQRPKSVVWRWDSWRSLDRVLRRRIGGASHLSFSCPARHTNASLSPQMSKMKEQQETAKKSKVYRKQDCLGPGTRRNVSQGSARISNRGLYSALLRYQRKSDADSPGGRDKGVTMRRRKTQEIPGSCTFCNCATPSNSSTPS